MGSLLKTATHDARITGESYAPAVEVSTNRKPEVLLPDIFFQVFWPDFGAVHVAVRIGGDAFPGARAREFRLLPRIGIRNEVLDGSILRAADADTALPAVVVARHRFRLRVGHENRVLLVDVDPARPAELLPLGQVLAILIEDLNPIVVPIADKQPALRVHRERMRLIEFVRAGASLAPRFDQRTVLREFENAIDRRAVADGHEDVAVGRDEHVVRPDATLGRRRPPCFTERHETLSLGAELDH